MFFVAAAAPGQHHGQCEDEGEVLVGLCRSNHFYQLSKLEISPLGRAQRAAGQDSPTMYESAKVRLTTLICQSDVTQPLNSMPTQLWQVVNGRRYGPETSRRPG